MKKIVSYVAALGLLAAGFTVAVTSTPATATESSTAFGLAINKFEADINQPCPKGSVTVFYAKVKVAPGYDGQMIDNEYDRAVLVRQGGRKLVTDLDLIGPTGFKGELIWITGRKAKLDVNSNSDYVQFNASGPNMDFKLSKVSRDCAEDLDGEEG